MRLAWRPCGVWRRAGGEKQKSVAGAARAETPSCSFSSSNLLGCVIGSDCLSISKSKSQACDREGRLGSWAVVDSLESIDDSEAHQKKKREDNKPFSPPPIAPHSILLPTALVIEMWPSRSAATGQANRSATHPEFSSFSSSQHHRVGQHSNVASAASGPGPQPTDRMEQKAYSSNVSRRDLPSGEGRGQGEAKNGDRQLSPPHCPDPKKSGPFRNNCLPLPYPLPLFPLPNPQAAAGRLMERGDFAIGGHRG